MTTNGAAGQVPIIDFGPFLHGDLGQRQVVAASIFEAFRTVGFVYLINHGVPEDELRSAFSWSKKFFDLPSDVKETCPHPFAAWHHRGYSGIGKEKVSQMVFDEEKLSEIRKTPDMKESFDIGSEEDLLITNVWPDESMLPNFRASMMSFYWTCHNATRNIQRAIALGLQLPESFFDSYHVTSHNQLRLLHYPRTEEKTLRGGQMERIGAHSDFGTFTILFQDDCGGLEVEDQHQPGVFKPAPPIPGAIIVNIGDFLMRWSNDTLKSTLHRVGAPPLESEPGEDGVCYTKERYSIPYFVTADRGTVVDCLPGTWSELNPKKYPPIDAWDYIKMRMNATY